MGYLTQALARSSNELDPLLMGLGDPTEPSLLSQLGSGALKVGGTLLKPLVLTGDLSRALVGLLQGQKLSDRGVFGIPTVSGERMIEPWLEKLGIELPPNIPGKAEWRDVPGFLAEMGTDPLFFAPFGAMTKLGKGAAQATKLLKAAKVPGLVPEVTEQLLKDAGKIMERAGGKLGALPEMQGLARSERQFLSFAPPFMKTRKILPGSLNRRLVGATRASLRGAGQLGRLPGVGRAVEAVESRLLPRGVPTRGYKDIYRGGERVGGREELKVLRDAARVQRGLASWEAREAAVGIERVLRETDPEKIAAGNQWLHENTAASFETALLMDDKLQKLKNRIAKTTDPEKLARYQAEHDRRISRFARIGAQIPQTGFGARRADHQFFNTVAEAFEQAPKGERELVAEAGRLNQRINHLYELTPQADWHKLEGKIRRWEKESADRMAPLLLRQKVSKEFIDYMANAMPEVLAEVERLHRVTGRRLVREMATGGSVWELADPYLAYLHRAISPGGRNVMKWLRENGIRDAVANKFDPLFTRTPGPWKPRVRELDHMGLSVANDFLEADFRRAAAIKAAGQGITDKAAAALKKLSACPN